MAHVHCAVTTYPSGNLVSQANEATLAQEA